jgi:EAL domain-containing protein (putative c-di-GMP-specific phosphodiesterase class I)
LDSVAEGVESAEEFSFVVREGATMVQGFFFSPAIPLPDLAALIASQNLRPHIHDKDLAASAA